MQMTIFNAQKPSFMDNVKLLNYHIVEKFPLNA
jgi:hypothetical protein